MLYCVFFFFFTRVYLVLYRQLKTQFFLGICTGSVKYAISTLGKSLSEKGLE